MRAAIPVAISGVLGGILGGYLVHLLDLDVKADPQALRVEKVRDLGQGELSVDDEKDSKLADRLRTVEHRIALLTAAMQKSDVKDDSDDHDVVDLKTGDSTDVADPVFEAAVLDIVDRERERKDEEQVVWRKKLQDERGRRLAGELTSSLQLNPQQETEIAQAVADYFDQMRVLRDSESPDQPVTRKERREQRDKMNQAADEKLKQILSPEQFQKYETLDPDEQLGFGRRSPSVPSKRSE